MRSTERSLVLRVGLAAGGSAVLAALLTLAVAMVVVDRRVIAEARHDALSRADAFVAEIDESAPADGPPSADALEEEIREFSHGGVAIAVDGPSGRLAGPADMPGAPGDGCHDVSGPEEEWMVCGARTARGELRVVVGERTSELLVHRGPLLLGGGVALLVAALFGLLSGLGVGRWSLRPLLALTRSLAGIDPGAPRSADRPSLPRAGLAEVDELASTLDGLFDRLSAELERSRRFAADAAHELRTPMAKLRAELDLMLEDENEGTTLHAALARQRARVDDLSRLVERLLWLASPEPTLRGAGLVSVSALVEAAVAELPEPSRVAAALNDDGMVVGDATVLTAVVSNAIGNALKYSAGPVRVLVREESEHVVLRVDDEGPGIALEHRDRAFEGFFRAPAHRGAEGHGIGLALIAHVVRAHGGSARFVDGSPGAHLEVRLPRPA
ncbi:MAG: sensor histidine kinase [Sandaracinaceae bacterium]